MDRVALALWFEFDRDRSHSTWSSKADKADLEVRSDFWLSLGRCSGFLIMPHLKFEDHLIMVAVGQRYRPRTRYVTILALGTYAMMTICAGGQDQRQASFRI